MYDILILILALILFTVLAFLRVGAMPLAGIVALVTCVLARLPILDTMLGPFMETAAGYVKNYCFVFFLGAVFSALYEGSNGAITILTLTHMNHKTAYWDICVTQLIIPLLTVFAVTIPLCSLGL